MKIDDLMLGTEFPDLEEKISLIDTYYTNYDASYKEVDTPDKIREFRDRLQGVEQVTKGLSQMYYSAQRAASIALCALNELERIKNEYPDVVVRGNYGARCKDPRKVVSEASVLISELTPGVQERIYAAILHGNQLFGLSQLDEPIEQAYVGGSTE